MKYTSLKQVKELYKDVFYMEEDMILDAIIATCISSKIKGDPIWLLIIGGSSSGKSELVNILNKVPFVYPISSLTENTFLSNMRLNDGKEGSLLHQIGTSGMITMKDYTSVLSMRNDKASIIVAQMREIYDGELTKRAGNGNSQKWVGKINWVGAVTDSIYVKEGESAGMGRRTINYVMPLQDRKRTIRAASKNTNDIEEKRLRIQEAVAEFVAYKLETLTGGLAELTEDVEDDIVDLADFVTIARTPTERNFKGELRLVPDAEGGTRVFSMFKKMVQMMVYISDTQQFEKCHYDIMAKIALDSIPKQRTIPLRILAQYTEGTKKGIAIEANYPTDTMGEWLEDLNVLGVITRREVPAGADQWSLKPEYKKLIQKFTGIKDKGAKLYDAELETPGGHEIQPTWMFNTNNDDKGLAKDNEKAMQDMFNSL